MCVCVCTESCYLSRYSVLPLAWGVSDTQVWALKDRKSPRRPLRCVWLSLGLEHNGVSCLVYVFYCFCFPVKQSLGPPTNWNYFKQHEVCLVIRQHPAAFSCPDIHVCDPLSCILVVCALTQHPAAHSMWKFVSVLFPSWGALVLVFAGTACSNTPPSPWCPWGYLFALSCQQSRW